MDRDGTFLSMATNIFFFDDSSSDGELEEIIICLQEQLDCEESSQSRGKKRRTHIQRNSLEGHQRLVNDYFIESSVYPHSFAREI